MPLTFEPTSVYLKKETAERHSDVEKTLNPFIANIQSFDDYALLLKIFYGFFYPLQKNISQVLTDADLSDIHDRKLSSFIPEDLHAIGQPVSDLPICQALPTIVNKAYAFGCLYVLEGSSLGGRVIKKWLQSNSFISLQDEQISFFDGYKDQTGAKWKLFLEALNLQEDIDNVINGANETFHLFENWINKTPTC